MRLLDKRYALCLIPIFLSLPAWAGENLQNLPLENLLRVEVESASRFAQPLSDAPSSVSVLSAEEIRQFGFRTIGDALQSMRGVYTTNERDYTYLGIRGFARPGDYNTRMLLQTDGIRRNDPLFDSALIGNEAPIEIEWVKRLEFVPGPSSALYGANALFGVTNAIMWSGADLNGTRVRADLGTGDMARVGVLSGRRMDSGGDWLFGFSAYGRRGQDLYFSEFDSPATNHGIASGRDGERYLKGIAKLSMGNWQLDAGYSFRHKDVPTGYFGATFNAPSTYVIDRYGYADATYFKAHSAELSSNLRVRAGDYWFKGQYAYPGRDNRDEAQAIWFGLDYLGTYTGLKDHKLLFGVETQNNRHLDQSNFDLLPRVNYLNDQRHETRGGIYLQDEWRLGPKWLANLGVRADRLAGYDAVSPRAALIHHPSPDTALKLIYGRAFRPPNSYERYYDDSGQSQKANPNLKLERITTQDFVVDYAITPAVRVSGDYYHYRIDDMIDEITDPADGLLTYVNRPTVHAHGVEFEVEAFFAIGLHLKGSIARQHVEQPFGPAINSSKLLGKLLLDGPLFSTGWTVGLDLQAMDRRDTLADQVAGHAAGNLILRRKGTRATGSWTVGIYNLAGRRYFDPASAAVARHAVLQDGRQLRLSWELGF